MNPATAEMQLLADLPFWAFAAVMLIARLGSACMLLPGIGEAEVPGIIRAGFVLALVALMLPVLGPQMPPIPADPIHLAAMVMAEIVTGLWLGWLVRLVLLALPMAGQLMAGAVGMTSVLQPDALLGSGAAALSRLLGLVAPLLVMASGLYAVPFTALVGSYQLIHPGTMLPVGETVDAYVGAVASAFGLALRLASPFLMAGVLFHVSVGLISRLVPHLQTHFASVPGQIIGGLLLLGLLAGALTQVWMDDARGLFAALPGL
jgi:flagellar biosynthetic protein FliR